MEPWEDKKCIDEEKEHCTKKWMTVGYAKVCKMDLNVYRNKKKLNHLKKKIQTKRSGRNTHTLG